MSKRYTDTDKWMKSWYRKLGSEGRDLWNYLHETCDIAGIVEIDLDRMSFDLGFTVTMSEIERVTRGKIKIISKTKVYLTDFISFQQTALGSSNAHKSIIKKLKQAGINEIDELLFKPESRVPEGFPKPTSNSNSNSNSNVIVKRTQKNKTAKLSFDFDALYHKYPRKEGKSEGIKKCEADIKTQDDYNLLSLAIDNYKKAKADVDEKYIKIFSSFMTTWRDWTDPSTGRVNKKSNYNVVAP